MSNVSLASEKTSVETKGDNIGDDESEFEFHKEEVDEEINLAMMVNIDICDEPQTYQEAMNREDCAKWAEAIDEELRAHEKCGTWKIVRRNNLPDQTTIIKARWVNKIKIEANGTQRYRSRLVAKGFADRNYYDRSEIYAPVARLSDVRFILIIANEYDLELIQFDVKTAFLNGTLEKAVFMEIPEGLEERVAHKYNTKHFSKDYVCELKRALYGLKVSPKRWFIRFREAMERMGFENYPFQPCLFIWRENNKFAILLLYIDDILLCTNCVNKSREVGTELRQEFEVTELGEPKKFLGLQIERRIRKPSLVISIFTVIS